MSKVIMFGLAAGAFFYAVWLILRKKELPDPRGAKGIKKRFILATLLCAALLSSGMRQRPPDVTCYDIVTVTTPTGREERLELAKSLESVWLTLDQKKGERFRAKLEAAVADGVIRARVADMLAIAYEGLAEHKWRTSGEGRMATCYMMTPLAGGAIGAREKALEQIRLLEEAKKFGVIDEETARKSFEALAREIQAMYEAERLGYGVGWAEAQRFIKDYNEGGIAAGDSAEVSSDVIITMQAGSPGTAGTAAERLERMKSKVEQLLLKGPATGDWGDPDIHPNLQAVLEAAGLVSHRDMVTCYDRSSIPVKERSEELKVLQAKLLDRYQQAGVIDAEMKERVQNPYRKELKPPKEDYAVEQEIAEYQKTVQRVMRILYEQGEVPSDFVEQVERAADIEIIEFDTAKTLREDVRFYFGYLRYGLHGERVLAELEKREILLPPENHRMQFVWPGRETLLEQNETAGSQPEMFLKLLDNPKEIRLDQDDQEIEEWTYARLPDLEYRIKVRDACRALIRSGITEYSLLKSVEKAIEIPIAGTLKKP